MTPPVLYQRLVGSILRTRAWSDTPIATPTRTSVTVVVVVVSDGLPYQSSPRGAYPLSGSGRRVVLADAGGRLVGVVTRRLVTDRGEARRGGLTGERTRARLRSGRVRGERSGSLLGI